MILLDPSHVMPQNIATWISNLTCATCMAQYIQVTNMTKSHMPKDTGWPLPPAVRCAAVTVSQPCPAEPTMHTMRVKQCLSLALAEPTMDTDVFGTSTRGWRNAKHIANDDCWHRFEKT